MTSRRPSTPRLGRARPTIRNRLGVFALILILPLLVTIAFGLRANFESDRAEALDSLHSHRRNAQQAIEKYLANVRFMLTELGESDALQDLTSPRAREACALFLRLHPEFLNVGITDLDGYLRFSTTTPVRNPPQHYPEIARLRPAFETRRFQLSDASAGRRTGRWGSEVMLRLSTRSELLFGAAFDLQLLSSRIYLAPDTPDMIITVTDRQDTVVLSSLTPTTRIGQKRGTASNVRSNLAAGNSTGEFVGIDHVRRTYDASLLTYGDWLVVAAIPSESIYHDAWQNLLHALGIVGLVVVLSIVAILHVSRVIARPIVALAEAARAHTEDHTDVLAPVIGPREIATTAQAFNDMIASRQRSKIRTRQLIDSAIDAVITMDDTGAITQWNKQAEAIFGWSRAEALGRPLGDLIVPERWRTAHEDGWQRYLATREATMMGRRVEIEALHRDGHEFPVELSLVALPQGDTVHFGAFLRDLTEQKKADAERATFERKIQETQKLESLGLLAGGIAHDFNNILTGVLGHASLAKLDLPPDASVRDNLDQIEKSTRRAAELCKQMLAYAGKGRFVVQELNLNSLIEDTAQLLHISISKRASLRLDLAADLPAIRADTTQIRQVLMNLVINASEALGERTGAIVLSTGRLRADDAYLKSAQVAGELAAGDYVSLEVTDSGAGMARETLDRIFDPFFTTKFTGRGLGLAAVQGIMRGHGGAIKVYSEPGRGSTFKLLFPVADGPATAIASLEQTATAWRGSGQVLLVDDEESVRNFARSALTKLGFSVVAAADGHEALKIFQRSPQDFRLVLLDLTMPNLDGEETFRHLRQLNPAVRVVLMSGFNKQEAIAGFTGKGLAGFVAKPFGVDTLASEVRRVLEAPDSAT